MIGTLAVGETIIYGLLESEDVLATVNAMRQLGADIVKNKSKNGHSWSVYGRGIGGLVEPDSAINLGNSGTAARLISGIIASHNIKATLIGDPSLSSRPMDRVLKPLQNIGAHFFATAKNKMPITINGTRNALPTETTLEIASAQIKSALLLAGLNATGYTVVIERAPTRDHTEKMLQHFGADISTEEISRKGRRITLVGQPELTGRKIIIPGDISSAAFLIIGALITPDSDLTVKNIGINPLRTGILDSLKKMGANFKIYNIRENSGEPQADIRVRHSQLRGVTIPAHQVPRLIDEYPILSIAASVARGTTVFEGIGELRVKESDRLSAISEGLEACGIETQTTIDTLIINGTNQRPKGGATIASRLDHRIAMSYLILGLISKQPITIDDSSPIETSFPGFINLMNKLGANMKEI